MVRVQFFGQVREIAKAKETEVADCPTVGSLLCLLSASLGHEFRPEALIVMVNGRHIAHTGYLDTPLEAGDLVSVFPVIGGG
jgi:molybdopterin synthase sulfur carrier subunit